MELGAISQESGMGKGGVKHRGSEMRVCVCAGGQLEKCAG